LATPVTGRNIELLIAVSCDFVPRSHYPNAVLAHQAADTTTPDIQANFLQLFGYSRAATLWTLLRSELRPKLRRDCSLMPQLNHIRSLRATDWTAPERSKTAPS
jgi:hypothetical protein